MSKSVPHKQQAKLQNIETLRQRSVQLGLVNRSVQTICSSLKLDQVLSIVLEEVRNLLGVAGCSIWLLDSDTNELVCQQAAGPQKEVVTGWRMRVGLGIVGWVVEKDESLIITDTRKEDRHFKAVDQKTGVEIRSMLTVPLREKGMVIGVLQVVDTSVSRFDVVHRDMLEGLAGTAAISIVNARLYQQARKEIEERLAAEDELRKSEERFRLLVETMNEGLVQTGKDGLITYANPSFLRMLDYSDEQILGKRIEDFLDKEDRKTLRKNRPTSRKTGKKNFEISLISKDGRRIPSLIAPQRILDTDGKSVGYFAVITDITSLKQTEAALRQRERELGDKVAELQEMDTALRVMITKREEDKQDLESTILMNIRELVDPYIEKLRRSRMDTKQEVLLEILADNLSDIISPFSRSLSSTYLTLTPKEIQIASLIKQGKTTKDIADVMAISTRTVDTHRKNLRQKLGIGHRKANLRAYLQKLK